MGHPLEHRLVVLSSLAVRCSCGRSLILSEGLPEVDTVKLRLTKGGTRFEDVQGRGQIVLSKINAINHLKSTMSIIRLGGGSPMG